MSELKSILEHRGNWVTDSDLRQIMAAVDEDGSGEIDFNEFVKMMSAVGFVFYFGPDKVESASNTLEILSN